MSLDAEERAILDSIHAAVIAWGRPSAASAGAPASGWDDSDVASDRDLDGEHGDGELKKSPPRWKGRDLTGKRWSQLVEEELECLLGFCRWKYETNAKELASAESGGNAADAEKAAKAMRYAKLDASRLRGWMRRLKQGWKPATVSDDIPF